MSRRFQCLLAITDITVPKRSKIAYTAAPVWKELSKLRKAHRQHPAAIVYIYASGSDIPHPTTGRIGTGIQPERRARSQFRHVGRQIVHLPSERHISYGRTSQASNGELNDKRFLESFGRLLAYRCETHKACIVALASCKVVHKHVVR